MDTATCSMKLARFMSRSERPAHSWVLRVMWTWNKIRGSGPEQERVTAVRLGHTERSWVAAGLHALAWGAAFPSL